MSARHVPVFILRFRRLSRLACACLLIGSLAATSLAAAAPQPDVIAVADEQAFFAQLDLDAPALASVKEAAARRDWSGAKAAWARHVSERQSPRWFWEQNDRARIKQIYDQAYGGFGRSIAAADKVLDRTFVYGGVPRTLAPHIDWRQGPGTWTQKLNRHEYFSDLGRAYFATGDARYAADFVHQLSDWIADNPVPTQPFVDEDERGKPWRTLEAGVRASSWLEAMQLFSGAPEFDAQAKYLATKGLVEHARYLASHAVDYRAGNWQVVECSGLAQVAIMLPEFKEAAAWRERGLSRLVEHMERDVMPDGGHYEITPGYHLWVAQQFAAVARLCQLNDLPAAGLSARHEAMYDWLLALCRSNGHVPSIGDGGTADGPSMAEAFADGAALYGRADMKSMGSRTLGEASLWTLGPDAFDRYAAMPSTPPSLGSSLLADSQLAVMRTGGDENESRYLLFDAAPRRGAHTHNDALQIVLSAGRDLLLDPGIYNYDQPLCATYLRKAEAHNVLLIDGKDRQKTMPKLLNWTSDRVADFACGEATADGVTHRRSVLFVKPNGFVIVDRVEGEGTHELSRLFHFPAGGTAIEGAAVRTTFDDGANVRVTAVDGATPTIVDGWLTTGPATAVRAPVASFAARAALPATFCTVVAVEDAGTPPLAIERLPSDNASIVRLKLGTDEIEVDGAGGTGSRASLHRAGDAASWHADADLPPRPTTNPATTRRAIASTKPGVSVSDAPGSPIVVDPNPVAYKDGRPSCKLRLNATDYGPVLRYGDGPDGCDRLGARDVWAWTDGRRYFMHYDGAGPKGWLACLAVSDDLVDWQTRGPILDFGKPGEEDSASASYGVTYFENGRWHLFYLGTPNVTPAPDFVPSFPYLTMKATGDSPAGPWRKQPEVVPMRTKPDTYYSITCSPGHVVRQGDEYLQFFSSTTDAAAVKANGERGVERTLGIARTKDLDGPWTPDAAPLVPTAEQVENSSLYFDATSGTWFLFTNHIGLGAHEYTDAIWVYWSKSLDHWNADDKAVVLDASNSKTGAACIGLPSVVPMGDRLAIFYDAPRGGGTAHMRRDVGLAWLQLPIRLRK